MKKSFKSIGMSVNHREPSYLYSPHPQLPGVFDAIPVNRKARRAERKKPIPPHLTDDQKEAFLQPVISPQILNSDGSYLRVPMVKVGDKNKVMDHWRVSRRQFVRAKLRWMKKWDGVTRSRNAGEIIRAMLGKEE